MPSEQTENQHLRGHDQDAWVGFLTVHSRLTRELDTLLSASHGMPLTEYEVLLKLRIGGGRMRMSDLAEACLLSRSGLTRIINELEAQQLVRREPDEQDGRVFYATITRLGASRFRAARKAHIEQVHRLFLDLLSDDQRRAMAAGWSAILQALDERQPAPRIRGVQRRAAPPPVRLGR